MYRCRNPHNNLIITANKIIKTKNVLENKKKYLLLIIILLVNIMHDI